MIQDNNNISQGVSNLGNFQMDRQMAVNNHSKAAANVEMKIKDGFEAGVSDDVFTPRVLRAGIDLALSKAEILPKSSLDLDGYMLPDNEGRVKHLVMTVGGIDTIRDNYLEVIKTLVSEMPDAKFTLLVNGQIRCNDIKDNLAEWTSEGAVTNPERVNVVKTGAAVSVWAQDSLLVSGNRVIEQERKWFPGWGDGEVAGEIARVNSELKHEKLEGVFIDGGNQRATKDKIFVGSDAIAFALENMNSYPSKYYEIASNSGMSKSKAESMPKEELMKAIMDSTFPHQEIVIVGHKGEQPAFHIDMAVTPLGKTDPESGKPVMIVGDPNMAINILKDLKVENPAKYRQYQKEIKRKVDNCPDDPLDQMVDRCASETHIQENFDALAKGFEKSGYHVERVPYLGSSSLRYMPWVTYNNSVIDGDNVFIPNFSIPELDNPGNEAYGKFGYKPIPIDMTSISALQGAINCITKVVEREYE